MACKFLISVCLCCCYLFCMQLNAQEFPHFVEKLTTEEGLSSNKINGLAQDDHGFLWIATSDGLNRFDGTEVVQYFHQDNVNSILHNYVYCLKKMPDNFMAIGTQGGLSFYNGNNGMFQNFYYRSNTALDEFNNVIIRLDIDKKGNLWAVSRNCIFIFDTKLALKKVINSPFTIEDSKKLRLRFAEKIIPLSDGYMLLYLYNGLFIYSPVTNDISRLENSLFKEQLKFANDISSPLLAQNMEQYFPPAHVFKIFDHFFLCIKPGADSLLVFDENGKQAGNCYFP